MYLIISTLLAALGPKPKTPSERAKGIKGSVCFGDFLAIWYSHQNSELDVDFDLVKPQFC